MASTSADAAPVLTLPAAGNLVAAAIIFALFTAAAVVSAQRKDMTKGFDEVAHASYVAHIQHTGSAWPALAPMRLLDPRTFQFTEEANYLNHPPVFYALLAVLGPKLEGHPRALLADRLIDVAIAACGLAALLGLGLAAPFPRQLFYAYAVPLACIPVLVPIAGAVNNDNLAFFGGAVAMLGLWQCLCRGSDRWLVLVLVGVVAASWAKLTGLLLTAPMVGGGMAYLLWRGRLPRPWVWAIALVIAVVLAAIPYVYFVVHYGSPTPETPAQLALIESGARAAGWADLPRRSLAGYLGYFIVAFIADWMPTLSTRSTLNDAMLVIPATALVCALAGTALSLRRLWRGRETALDVLVICGMLAIAATFAIHVAYSYGRYTATGWLLDAYPRYYLPLIAIVPLAGLSLVRAMEGTRWRSALLGFLIAGPIVFRLLGAPLG